MSIVNGLEKVYGERIDFVRANIHDPKSRALMDLYSFSATPEFYLVDPRGRIIAFWNDVVPEAELRQAFDAALTTNPARP
jgi:hypothetical protein